MSTDLQIIGGLNEKELMNVDYAELPESGQGGVERVYDLSQYGWMRFFKVNIIIVCFKRDIDTVIAAFPSNPTNLTSVAGRNNDGTTATRIQWGADYILKDISPSSRSPSMVNLAAQYRKDVAEAQVVYPAGLTTDCVLGVYTVVYEGITFKTFDNGTGVCGSRGLEFVKAAQEKRRVTVHIPDNLSPHVNSTVQERSRWYNILRISVDGVIMETQQVLLKEENLGTATIEGFNPAQNEEVIHETTFLGTTYPSELKWEAQPSVKLQLLWSGFPVWDFVL